LGEDPHVHIEHVFSGDGVDIGNIGLFFGGLKGGIIGFEKGVPAGEFLREPVMEPYRQIRSGKVGVGALIRPGTVGLKPPGGKLRPDKVFSAISMEAPLGSPPSGIRAMSFFRKSRGIRVP
jgi:hypothetical protein